MGITTAAFKISLDMDTPGSQQEYAAFQGGLPTPSVSKEMKLDDVLELIPTGKFHYRLLIICGMSFMADAMVFVLF